LIWPRAEPLQAYSYARKLAISSVAADIIARPLRLPD
jgi:hypothetical protein